MFLPPRLIYAGNKDIAASYKGVALQFYEFLVHSKQANQVSNVPILKKLQDGTVIQAIFKPSAYHIECLLVINTPSPSGNAVVSGFLIKERDELGDLTGKLNLLQTDNTGYTTILLDVAMEADTVVWTNKSVLSTLYFAESKRRLANIATENLLLSWAGFGRLFSVWQTKELVDVGGFWQKTITVRIKGVTQEFVIPHQTLDVIQADVSKDGKHLTLFCMLPDGDDMGLPSGISLTGYASPTSCVVTDKWVMVVTYEISKDTGTGLFVFTQTAFAQQYQGWIFQEKVNVTYSGGVTIEVSREGSVLYGENVPIWLNFYYEGNTLKRQDVELTLFSYRDDTRSVSLFFNMPDAVECEITLFAEMGYSSLNSVYDVKRLNQHQRYAKITPYTQTSAITNPDSGAVFPNVKLIDTTLIDDSGVSESALSFVPNPIYPIIEQQGVLFLPSVLATVYAYSQLYLTAPLSEFDAKQSINANIVPLALNAVRFPTSVDSYTAGTLTGNEKLDLSFIFPRFCFTRQDYGWGTRAEWDLKHFKPMNNDFVTALTDRFNNHCVLSYGADYEQGRFYDSSLNPSGVEPTITLKIARWIESEAIWKEWQPVTHLLKRSDIVGVI